MKVLLVLLLCSFGFVQSQFGLFNLGASLVQSQLGVFNLGSFFSRRGSGGSGGYDVSNRVDSCPIFRCRNVDKRKYLIKRNLSPNFPYHHLQHLRRPSTHYTSLATNVWTNDFRTALNKALNRRGAFLAYDSAYDPIYNPCTDCDGSGYGGEYCMTGQCYFERTFLIGDN